MRRDTAVGGGRGFRTRKLSNKQNLQVLHEHQIDAVGEDDGQRNIPQVETGVERQEETEHHLQAVIGHQAAAGGPKLFIPTPNTSALKEEHYARLYPQQIHQPASYIRFSSTVEDCSGTAYCMSAADEQYLTRLNAGPLKEQSPLTVNDFESIMDYFETTVQQRQPYLHTDVSRILSFQELIEHADRILQKKQISAAKHIYEHWKNEKLAREGRPIIPVLKSEQGTEKDEGDPYVCFRRRELRQVRKTRRTDAQSSDKLRKLRQELETARGLVKDVYQRESVRYNLYKTESAVFEKRQKFIMLRRQLNIRGDDEDLLLNKPRKKPQDQVQAPAMRAPRPPELKMPEVELRQLSDVKEKAERVRQEQIARLQKALEMYMKMKSDITEDIIMGNSGLGSVGQAEKYVGVQAYHYPSPPTSEEFEESQGQNDGRPSKRPRLDSTATEEKQDFSDPRQVQVKTVQKDPKKDVQLPEQRYRTRIGRGGRVLLDRRHNIGNRLPQGDGSKVTNGDLESVKRPFDKYKYDEGDDDVAPTPVYKFSTNSNAHIHYRAAYLSPPPEAYPGMAGMAPVRQSQQMLAPVPPMNHGPHPMAHRAAQPMPQQPRPQQQQFLPNGQANPSHYLNVPRSHSYMQGNTAMPPVPQLLVNGQAGSPGSSNWP